MWTEFKDHLEGDPAFSYMFNIVQQIDKMSSHLGSRDYSQGGLEVSVDSAGLGSHDHDLDGPGRNLHPEIGLGTPH